MSLKWNYRRAFLRCALLVAAGTVLQLTAGDIDAGFLRYPWGVILSVNYVYLLVVAYAFSDRYGWLRTLWDWKACLSSAFSLLVLVIVFGLVRQDASAEGFVGAMGWSAMSSSWAFNFILFYFMTSLGIRVVSEIVSAFNSCRILPGTVHGTGADLSAAQSGDSRMPQSGRWKDFLRRLPRLAVHTGIFLLLVAGVFGSADKQRYKVVAQPGVPVDAAVTDIRRSLSSGQEPHLRGCDTVRLPFIITLSRFAMEEYPPKLYIYDSDTGVMSREFFQVEKAGERQSVGGWSLLAEEYLGMAGRMPGDSSYKEMKHVGTAPAVFVTAVREDESIPEARTGDHLKEDRCDSIPVSDPVSGWVSCGSHVFGSSVLPLEDGKMVVMPYPEAKGYTSEVRIVWPDGKVIDADIRVNHPAKTGPWRIYQSGYDTSRGKWSSVSILECVHDPWYRLVHVALWMVLCGGILIFLTAGAGRRTIRRDGHDVRPGGSDKERDGYAVRLDCGIAERDGYAVPSGKSAVRNDMDGELNGESPGSAEAGHWKERS